MNRRLMIVHLALLLVLGLLVGCESRTEHVVGAVLPLTGSGSTYAEDIRNGIELGLDILMTGQGVRGSEIAD